MRCCFTFLILLITALLTVPTAAAPIELVRFEPTPLFPRQEQLVQLAYLTVVNNADAPVPLRARVALAGQPEHVTDLGTVPHGESTHSILLPDVDGPTKLVIDLLGPDGTSLAHWEGTHEPQRKWVVYVVKSSHEDLGYEDYIFNKQTQIANNIDLARKLSGEKDGPPGAAKPSPRHYHYQMESLIFERNYVDERSEAAWRDVVEQDVKTGRMALIGVPNGAHTHWMDYEELARFMYPGRRDLRDRFGLGPKTFLIVDNPSLSWSACQAAVDAGYHYICRFGQPWRTGGNNDYNTTKLPALFWWTAPDGKHKALFGWRNHYGLSFWYGQSGGGDANPDTMELGARGVTRELRAVESGQAIGPYPYDALLIPSYSDHEMPWFDGRMLSRWQTLYRYPDIRIAGAEDFFEYIEKKFGDKLPTLSGDLNSFSGDYATIDPESQGWKRQAARMLPLAESQATVASLFDIGFEPPLRQIDRTFTRLFDYDEHSWPTSPEASDVHKFNAQWVKRNEAARALTAAHDLLDNASGALFRSIPTGDEQSLVVFNPLAHERTDLVEVDSRFEGLVDSDSGKAVVTEAAGTNKTTFVATRVPAFGYKVYNFGAAAAPKSSYLRATDDLMENEFYVVRFDRETGTVSSILDKQLNRELVDPKAAQRFNQLVWVHAKNRLSPDLTLWSPAKARSIHGQAGPVRAEVVAQIDDPKTGAAITQAVRIYRGLKRIDVIDDLRHVRAIYSDRREDRYRDNIYYAFPIKVEDFQARAEYAGGVVRPYDDQLRLGSHDFLTANRRVDVSNRSFGVTLAPWNAPTVSFGDIRYNRFSIDYKPTSSYLFSYAWSNRMAGLITLCADDTNATLGYSFSSHEGNWDAGATTPFGWSVASPLQARILPAGQSGALPPTKASFLSVDAPNVQLTALKPSEQPGRGWIIRLVETEGKASDVSLDLPNFPIDAAVECNLVEDDGKPLEVSGHKVRLSIGQFAFATIRVFSKVPAPAAAADLRAEAASDSSIRLRWSPAAADKNVAYNVYRSEDPDAPPTAYTLIGRSTEPEFTDTGLAIDTTYYYCVAPVTIRNNQGPVSAKVSSRTLSENTSPPLPVEDLGIVRRAKDGLTVYWRKSREPDIARYLVFRGDRPDFEIGNAAPVGVVSPTKLFLQIYRNDGLHAGTTYYYKVLAEDWAGHRQANSPVVAATTPKE